MTKKKENDLVKTLRFHGISKRMLGSEMNLSQPTIKSYCDNPQRFRLDQLRTIGRLTDLNITEIDELIEDEKTK
jgi:predicted transcriptional regulator